MSGPHPDPLTDMLSRPHELDGRFESEAKAVTTCISDAALTSIAVSLKRIADLLEKRSVKSEHLRKLTELTEEYGGYKELNTETAQ